MAVYRLTASPTGLNTLSCIDSQVYQASDAMTTEFTFDITAPFLSVFARASQTKKGGIPTHAGQEYLFTRKAQKGG